VAWDEVLAALSDQKNDSERSTLSSEVAHGA